VASAFECGATRDAEADVHLRGDDSGECGLAQPGRAREEEVVDGLTAAARRREQDLEVLLQARLADELVEAARPQRDLLRLLDGVGDRTEQLFSHALTASSLSASRSMSSTDASAVSPSMA